MKFPVSVKKRPVLIKAKPQESLVESLAAARAALEPNVTCPHCGWQWFNAQFKAYRSVFVATICPHCKNGVALCNEDGQEKYGDCERCGGDVHPRIIFDMPFVVDENVDWCARCSIIRHLERRYENEVKNKLSEIAPQPAERKHEEDSEIKSP